MLLLKPFTEDPGRSMVHPCGIPPVHFHFASKVWEIHPSVTTITKDEFFDAWERTKNMKVLGPILENSVLYRDALAKELGL